MDIAVATKALELAIAGGLGAVAKNLFDYFTRRAEARTPAAIESSELAIADKAVIAAGHQIDGLLKDNDRLRQQLGQERDHFVNNLHHANGGEGMAAFLGKRPAQYR